MYTYQINIGAIATPVIGAGWVTVVPVISDAALTKQRESGQQFARVSFDGKIKFTGTTATALKTLSTTAQTVPFRIAWDGTYFYTGRLNIRTESDTLSAETWHTVETVDEYVNLLKGSEIEFNALGTGDRVTCIIDNYTWRFRQNTPFRTGEASIWTTPHDEANDVYIAEFVGSSEDQYAEYQSNGWVKYNAAGYHPDGQWQLMRSWDDSPTFTSIPITPANITNYLYIITSATAGDYAIGDYIYVSLIGAGRIVATDYKSSTSTYYYYMLWNVLPESEAPFEYTRFIRLDALITYLVGQIDSDILFDANSFDGFAGFDGTENLLYAAMSDMKLVDTGGTLSETSNPATRETVTWKQLWQLLSSRPFQFYWYLELSGSDYYFRVDHISNLAKTDGSFTLKNYKAVNWSVNKTRYSWSADYVNRISRNVQASNIDFLGVDITLPLVEDGSQESIDIGAFFFDVTDIFLNSSKYPDNGLVIVSADPGTTTDYVCRNSVGALTGLPFPNADLSIANLDATLGKFRLPFHTATINGVSAACDEAARRQTEDIYAPIRTPDEIDFMDLVPADVADIDPVTLRIPLEAISGGAIVKGLF